MKIGDKQFVFEGFDENSKPIMEIKVLRKVDTDLFKTHIIAPQLRWDEDKQCWEVINWGTASLEPLKGGFLDE